MTVDYNDGKIHGWNGGECPVHPLSVVEGWMECGEKSTATASSWYWENIFGDGNLIAFRVVKVFKEPKTLWVNEYSYRYYGYDSEKLAQGASTIDAIRVAVKYQEVLEN